MNRYARVASLRDGAEADYDRMHAAVWPEVRAVIAAAGVRNYSIFRHGKWLFSYFELLAGVTLAKVIAVMEQSPVCRRWEKRMRALRDPAFAADWLPMTEVFHENGRAFPRQRRCQRPGG